MTNLGATQVHSAGSYYRARYVQDDAPNQILDISPDMYTASQLWASAPDQSVSLSILNGGSSMALIDSG